MTVSVREHNFIACLTAGFLYMMVVVQRTFYMCSIKCNIGVLLIKDALYAEVVYGKMGVGNWYGLRQLAAELVFSNLSEALFGGTRAFAPKS